MKAKFWSAVGHATSRLRFDRSADHLIKNLPFNAVLHGAIFADPVIGVGGEVESEGDLLYELPLWWDSPGAVVVPVDPEGRIGFVRQLRPVVATFERVGQHDPPTHLLEGKVGRLSWELPRGFAEPGESTRLAAEREGREELTHEMRWVKDLGVVNPNTAYTLNNIPVVQCSVGRRLASGCIETDPKEEIRSTAFFSKVEIESMAGGEIVCAISLAACMLYFGKLGNKET